MPATLDGKTYHVALGPACCPQGACTSPAITNALCRKLDRRLDGLARRHGFAYTRYADDLTFSGDTPRSVGRLLRSVRSIVQAEGLTEHPRKTRVMRRGGRQEVTGLTVNDRPKVSREELRTLRAILHNAARLGLESQNRDGLPDFAAHLRGRVEYACMVDPDRAPAPPIGPLPGPDRRLRLIGPSSNRRRLRAALTDRTTGWCKAAPCRPLCRYEVEARSRQGPPDDGEVPEMTPWSPVSRDDSGAPGPLGSDVPGAGWIGLRNRPTPSLVILPEVGRSRGTVRHPYWLRTTTSRTSQPGRA